MKTTTIGRIGAIVAGAAMLGTAVASAFAGAVEVPSGLSKGFFVDANGVPQVQVVVGEKAAASDGAAAGQIAAMIGNMAFSTTTATQAGGTVEVQGGTTTCTPSAAECGAGSAEGQVKLSWAAIGLMGDLEQRQMDCTIYASGMDLINMTEGGDDGDWSDLNTATDTMYSALNPKCGDLGCYAEVYTPEDTVANNMIGSCEITKTDVSILKEGEFANEICSICYNFCDIALGCEPHLMQEWVEIYGERMIVDYDCTDERLEFSIDDDGAIYYNVFTDDILTEDVLDDDDDLVGQSYLGKIILGQHEYYVEDLDDDSITIVCGAKGTVTTTAPMEYVPPAEGSACDAGDSGQTYSIRLIGAQTIEEKGVVDVTLEVSRPDGATEVITTGISGKPTVGDIKVKLQRGTTASNVITGEQSFSAEILVYYVPSEYTFYTDDSTDDSEGIYDEQGVAVEDGYSGIEDVRAAWQLAFNGDASERSLSQVLTIADLCGDNESDGMEEDELLDLEYMLPEDIEENGHCDDCYEDAAEQDVEIVRYLRFSLLDNDNDLPEGELIQLPFNDGKYLLSELKFGYLGLMDDEFRAWNMQDKTTVTVSVEEADVYNDTEKEYQDFLTAVMLSYTDDDGKRWEVRIDEGPFDGGEMVLFGDDTPQIMRIDKVDYDDDDDLWNVTYRLLESDGDWSSKYNAVLDETSCDDLLVDSQLNDIFVSIEYCDDTPLDDGVGVWPAGSMWMVDSGDEPDEDYDDGLLYIDVDWDAYTSGFLLVPVADMVSGFDVQTEFGNDVEVWGGWYYINVNESNLSQGNITDGDAVVLYSRDLGGGQTQTGSEDQVWIWLDDSPYWNETDGSFMDCDDTGVGMCESVVEITDDANDETCDLGSDCDDIAIGDENGVLLSLSGALVSVTGDSDIEEPEDSGNDDSNEVISEVEMTVPENELRPTVFFGIESSQNTSSITITEADQGTIVDIGGIDVTVDEFGVSVSGGGVVVGGTETTVTCPSRTAECPDVQVSTKAPAAIGYKLVVLDSDGASKSNLVLVGGPAVNTMTADLVTVDDLCNPKTAVIKQATANKLVVAGCDASDTTAAADSLVTWLKQNV